MPAAKHAFLGAFCEICRERRSIGKVNLKSRSIRMTLLRAWAGGQRFQLKIFLRKFWRLPVIENLEKYPEKTDRFGAAAAAGKLPAALLFCAAETPARLLPEQAIDPLTTFSLSSPCAASNLVSSNARH